MVFVLCSSFSIITIIVKTNEDAGLEASMKDKEFIVRVVRLWWRYEWLVHSL